MFEQGAGGKEVWQRIKKEKHKGEKWYELSRGQLYTSSMAIPYELVHIDIAEVVSTMEITFSYWPIRPCNIPK